MADTTLTFSSKYLEDTPGNTGLVSLVNTALAPLLNEEITSFRFSANERQRRAGRFLDVLISYASPGAVALANPFTLLAYTGATLNAAVSQITDFQTANPAYWYSSINYEYIDGLSPGIDPYIAWVVYSQSGSAGSNWAAGSGGGGGGGAASVEVSASGVNAATTIDSVTVDDQRAVFWEVTVQDNAGNVETHTIIAQHDGTNAADATVADYTDTGTPATGTVTGSFAVDLNGTGATQTMRLRYTPTAGTWAITGYRRGLPVLTP